MVYGRVGLRENSFMASQPLLMLPLLLSSAAAGLAPAQYFDQRLDHFDGSNPTNWSQAYYVNDTFWKGGENSPVFLCVGGEGPAFDGTVVGGGGGSVHCNNAAEWLEEKGAIMFAVQHRYYGCNGPAGAMKDCPLQRWTSDVNADLHFLSSHQALADLANFHAFDTAKYSLSPDAKWISWGGSYPGMLAAWVRLKFPNLIHAAVSSSAPVRAKVEMTEYNNIAAAAYSVKSVGGSAECTAAITDGHAKIGVMMNTSAGRDALASQFNLAEGSAWLAERANQRAFAGEGVAYFPSQGNDPSSTEPMSNIALICATMTDGTIGDEVARLALVSKGQGGQEGLKSARSTSLRARRARFMRQNSDSGAPMPDFWGWQTCTEFAFYQTCDVASTCMYTRGLDLLENEMAFCQTDFNIPMSLVEQNVAQTNVRTGSDHPAGSRVLWVNGEVDPWHGLSVLKPLSASMPAIWVKGASHHAWTHPSPDCTQDTVIKARADIRTQVEQWLSEAA